MKPRRKGTPRPKASLPLKEARIAGHKRYVRASPCAKCGGNDFYVKSGICVQCHLVRTRRWSDDNREYHLHLVNTASRRQAIEDPKGSYERHRRNCAARIARGHVKPPRSPASKVLSAAFYKAKRIRSRQPDSHYQEILVDLTKEAKEQLLALRSHGCAYCHYEGKLHLDHKDSLAKGGRHVFENLQWLCPPHNMQKHSKNHEEYIEWCEERGIDLPKIRQMKLGQAILDDLF